MADISSHIESAPIPSIKSLRSRFEQIALDGASSGVQPSKRTEHSLSSVPLQTRSGLVSESEPTPRFRTRPSLIPDDCHLQSQPAARVCGVRSKVSNPDLKAVPPKRGPPPPPPPRTKKPPSSPVASPLLRPVPVPASLLPSRASPGHEFLTTAWADRKSNGADEGSEEGLLDDVTPLRSKFSAPRQIQTSKSSPPRPTTPRPSRPPMIVSHSDSVTNEHGPPAVPRHTKPVASDLSRSHSVDVSAGTCIATSDTSSPRVGSVAAMRDLFASKSVSRLHSRDDNLASHNEPNILITSPPALPVRPSPQPLNSTLFAKEGSLDIPGNSNSPHSPFDDDESEVSEISEVFLSPVAQPRKMSGFHGTHVNNTDNERQSSGSSSDSLSGLSAAAKPRPPPRPAPQAPPRQSRHQNRLFLPLDSRDSSLTNPPVATLVHPTAPPLPSRRVTQEEGTTGTLSSAPPLPARLSLSQSNISTLVEATLPVGERKPLGSPRLPPPPTRTIGLGDKLPPVRRVPSPSSDEESASEEDPRFRSGESLPDSSRSSRRPPSMPSANFMEYKMHVPAYSGYVAVAGSGVALASGHHIKYYDLSSTTGPLWTLDTRDGMRSSLVSCLEFRLARDEADRGRFLWIGTKEGHLFEVDVRTGTPSSSKVGLHASQVTHIFRHGFKMITIDEVGKTFFFDPSGNANAGVGANSTDDVSLAFTPPRVYRLSEKTEFAKLFRGLLWTAARTDVNGVGTTSVPLIRIYDIFALGSIGRAVMPNQHAGAVTSGTVLPSHADHVYLGHEGGYISIWNVATNDGIPACIEVVKVSTSDVLCLEGVNDRLWVGGRKGTISAYDVSTKPWVITNCWDAHNGLPVSRIFVDPYTILEMEKLTVVSVGRDEQIRFWDGLLGADRIEQELLKREKTFSTFRDLKVLIVTWNIDSAKPESLTGDPENTQFLHDVLISADSPDIISFGFQEVIDLESRKMAAKTVLLGGKKKGDEGKINEKVTSSYKRWQDRLIQAVRLAMPPESPYTVIHTESLVGLFTCMFIKNTEKAYLKGAAITTIKRGMGGRYGNKGGIAARFVVDDSSLCFINCHLAAGQHHVRQRNADVAAFLEETDVFPREPAEEGPAYVGGGDGSMVLDHEIVFLNGDMNYRIDQRREMVIAAIQSNDLNALLTHDQLHKEMKHNRAFRLRTFREGSLTFCPTYKYDRNSNVFDTSEKRRVPAWCDRVLWRSREAERVVLSEYRRWEANVSDHRPVSAVFRVTVKRVVGEARERERRVVEGWWKGAEVALLAEARLFYLAQAGV